MMTLDHKLQLMGFFGIFAAVSRRLVSWACSLQLLESTSQFVRVALAHFLPLIGGSRHRFSAGGQVHPVPLWLRANSHISISDMRTSSGYPAAG